MPPRDLRAFLFDVAEACRFDVAEACRLVEEFTRGKSAADYAGDPLLRSGVERQLEIVGEALNQALRNHPAELTDRMPEAPRITALRNELAHGYAGVADDIVWGTTVGAPLQSTIARLR